MIVLGKEVTHSINENPIIILTVSVEVITPILELQIMANST